MKRLIVLPLVLSYSLTILAQLSESEFNKKLLLEFCEFVESETGQPIFKQNKNVALFAPHIESTIANKASKTIQVLDSIVTELYEGNTDFLAREKYVNSYTYDKWGNQTSASEKLILNDTVSFVTTINFEYHKQKISSFDLCYEDSICLYKVEYFYKNEDLIEGRIFMNEVAETEWVLSQKVVYQYKNNNYSNITYFIVDSLGQEVENVIYNYNFEDGEIAIDRIYREFNTDTHFEYFYKFNEYGQIAEVQRPSILTGFYEKEVFTYNGHQKLDEHIAYFWEEEDITGFNSNTKTTFNYLNNKLISFSELTDNYRDLDSANTILSYDKNGFLNSLTRQIENENGALINNEKKDFKFDQNGNLHEKTEYIWNELDRIWKEENKLINTFNDKYVIKEEVLLASEDASFWDYLLFGLRIGAKDPYVLFNSYRISLDYESLISEYNPYWNMRNSESKLVYNSENKEWEEVEHKSYHYSEKTVRFGNNPVSSIVVYPNPASNFFSINIASIPNSAIIKIYNLNGVKILESPVAYDQQVDISYFQKGLYFFRLYVDDVLVGKAGKLIVQ